MRNAPWLAGESPASFTSRAITKTQEGISRDEPHLAPVRHPDLDLDTPVCAGILPHLKQQVMGAPDKEADLTHAEHGKLQ